MTNFADRPSGLAWPTTKERTVSRIQPVLDPPFRLPAWSWILAIGVLAWLPGCLEERFTSDPSDQPAFSTDTLGFDTVLTAISTVTRYFKVYNPHDAFLRMDEVTVVGDDSRFFRINVDGRPGPSVRDVTIPPGDSIYVFVEATIDPDQPESVSPFIIEARAAFRVQGTEQTVLLLAYGQNANYIPGPDRPNRISLLSCDLGTETWDDPRPYVLYGTLLIDSCTLVLPAGARLYVHGGIANNSIGIYQDGLIYTLPNGRMEVRGSLEKPVIIRDDRIEPDYTGTWAGLRFGPGSGPHHISYAEISQGLVGIYADSGSVMTIDHSSIFNTAGPGLLARHAEAEMTNCLFYGNDRQSVALTYGGQYVVDHCTMANFGNTTEALLLNNFYCTDPLCTEGARFNALQATVRNSILVGSSTDECWIVDATPEDPMQMQLDMRNNLVVVDDLLDPSRYPDFLTSVCLDCFQWANRDPLFLDLPKDDYHLDSLSVARSRGIPIPGLADDLEGKPRDPVTPDLGCYEFEE